MIEIVFLQASHFQNRNNYKRHAQPIKKKYLVVGRGQELQQLQDKTHDIINMKDFDHTLSRLHAVFMFSPAWFIKNQNPKYQENQRFKIPDYFYNFSQFWRQIPQTCLLQIWQFIKPQKKCILKDLNSKFGLFQSIKQEEIYNGISLSFGDSWMIDVIAQIKFTIIEDLGSFIEKKKSINYKILGSIQDVSKCYHEKAQKKYKQRVLKVWQLKSYQDMQKKEGAQNYLLLNGNNKILKIGRGSNSDICLKSSSISRQQAHLKCQNNIWKICDGGIKSRSQNGTWKKTNAIQIKRKQQSKQQELLQQYRIGLVKCQVNLQQLPWIDFQKLLNQNSQNEETLNFNVQTLHDIESQEDPYKGKTTS